MTDPNLNIQVAEKLSKTDKKTYGQMAAEKEKERIDKEVEDYIKSSKPSEILFSEKARRMTYDAFRKAEEETLPKVLKIITKAAQSGKFSIFYSPQSQLEDLTTLHKAILARLGYQVKWYDPKFSNFSSESPGYSITSPGYSITW